MQRKKTFCGLKIPRLPHNVSNGPSLNYARKFEHYAFERHS